MACLSEKTTAGWALDSIPLAGVLTDLFLRSGALGVDYFIERKELGKTKTLVPFPNQPENVVITRIFSETPIYTFASNYTYREIGQPRVVDVSISGRTGISVRLGINADGEVTNVDGATHLLNFDKFINKYMCDVANINTPVVYDALELDNVESYTKRPYLVFRAIKENLHGRCAINSFQFSRSVDSTRLGGFQWTMSLRVYDGADTKDPTRMEFLKHIDGVTQSINQISGLVEAVLSGVQGYVGQVTNSVGDVFRSVGALASTLGTIDNTAYGIAESVMGVVDDYMNMLGAVGSLVDSDEWASDLEGFEGTVSAYEARWKTGSSIQEEALAATPTPDLEIQTSMLVSDTSEMLYQANILLGYLGLAGRGGVSSPSQRRGFLGRKDGFEILSALYTQETVMSRKKDNGDQYRYEYIMRAGESLLTLANRFMGSPAEWATLAEINNCLDAHTFGDGSPILAGSIILIPISTEGVTMPLNPREVTTAEDAMHTDFYLLDGDLEIGYLGDLNLVGGLLNIKQAIINRIRSTVEEVTISPEYGLDFPLIGSKITSGDATLIAVKLRESLLDDARVLDVQDMTITPLGDTLTVQLTVLSIGRTSATFRVEI